MRRATIAQVPDGARSLARTADGLLLTAGESPVGVPWLAPVGAPGTDGPAGVLVSGGGAVWIVDRAAQHARMLAADGALDDPVPLPGVDRVAADGARLWWTARDDSVLRGGAQPVDLRVGPDARGGLVACAGSVWCSVAGGLLRVGGWPAELGPLVEAPEGPAEHLCCAGGILAGGSGRNGLFVLDPLVDADVRRLDVELGGPLDALVATRDVVWAFPAGWSEAVLVAVR